MRAFLPFALLTLAPVAAFAQAPTQPAAAVHVGQMLRDSSGGRIGAVTEVYKDGSVQVIYNSQLVTIPAASLTAADGKLTTSLTRKNLSQL
jgi:hypothetical protein